MILSGHVHRTTFVLFLINIMEDVIKTYQLLNFVLFTLKNRMCFFSCLHENPQITQIKKNG